MVLKNWTNPVLGEKMLFLMYEGALYFFLKFVAVLFKITPNCKQPKYPSVGECKANRSTPIQGNAMWPWKQHVWISDIPREAGLQRLHPLWSTYVTFWKRQLYRDREQRGVCQSLGWSESFPDGTSGQEPVADSGDLRCRFDPWVGKIPWRRTWQPTTVFLPGKPHRQEEPGGGPLYF